jgi:hypothetical protein
MSRRGRPSAVYSHGAIDEVRILRPGRGFEGPISVWRVIPDRPQLAEVVACAVEEPLGAAVLLASQKQPDQTLVLDLAEDRFHHLLSEPVGRPSGLGQQLAIHALADGQVGRNPAFGSWRQIAVARAFVLFE